MIRIGIDVGGTNTDAVVMDGPHVVAGVKSATTADVMSGVVNALKDVLAASKMEAVAIDVVMIGTTHFTNAVVQRRDLAQTAAVRLGLPATASLPPMVDWPEDLKQAIGNHSLARPWRQRVRRPRDLAARRGRTARHRRAKSRRKGINTIAITSVFSPVSSEFEKRAGEIFAKAIPGAHITLSSEIGRIGLLEARERGDHERLPARPLRPCHRGASARRSRRPASAAVLPHPERRHADGCRLRRDNSRC